MADTDQVGTEKKPLEKDTAVELSLMFAILAGSSASRAAKAVGSDSDNAYRDAVVNTFNEFLGSLGFEVVKKA